MDAEIRDYLSWRQADCHINNLYNTCFWNLVQVSGVSRQDAYEALKGTQSSDKNELLFGRFGMNYNDVDKMFRKGTTIIRLPRSGKMMKGGAAVAVGAGGDSLGGEADASRLYTCHEDVISDDFWSRFPFVLARETLDQVRRPNN